MERDGLGWLTGRRSTALLTAVLAIVWVPPAEADPVIVPTFEGQLGTIPNPGTEVNATSFFAAFVSMTEVPYTLRIVDTTTGEKADFEKDSFHTATPAELEERPTSRTAVAKRTPPASAGWLGDDDIAGVFAYTEDGSDPLTQGVVVAIVPTNPEGQTYVILDPIPTFVFADDGFNDVGVTTDSAGDTTVVFTEFTGDPPSQVPKVVGQRIDADGNTLGGFFDINNDPSTAPDVAILDTDGEALVVPTVEFGATENFIVGNRIDTTGAVPLVLPEFPISTSSGFNIRPAVAADLDTGAFLVAWENITGIQGNPVDIKARRFDSNGNPTGEEFTVNSTTANAQGQPDVAVGPNGESVVVWAGDGSQQQDFLDIFAQAYDSDNQPIGGEIAVNSTTAGQQDWPTVRFLPELDAQGRVQFAVAWRDVMSDADDTPNGTGQGVKCFSFDQGPAPIFADGFESGDTSSWSSETQN